MVETNDSLYQHPLTERYASLEMQNIFATSRRYGIWRRLWLALASVQGDLGLSISQDGLKEMEENLDNIDLTRAAEYEQRFRHDVMAHVHLFGDDAPSARGIIHLGATSAFITDNTDLIIHKQGLDLIRDRLVRCISKLSIFAKNYRDVPTLGFTHFQPAQPTTVGKRTTLWIQDFLLDLEEIEFRLRTIRFRGAKGTTGTQASFLQLFDGNHEKVEALDREISKRMGFEKSYAVTGQTYPRKVDAQILGSLANLAASTSKMGYDLRLLANLQEIEEPFEKEQIGSSAMPYKKNPMRSERICGMSRHVITLSQNPLFTAATQWLERSLDDSVNRRLSIPDAFLSMDGILVLVENVVSGLRVNEPVIQRNLKEHLPFMASETILMAATANGGDRQELHERIRKHSIDASNRMKEEGAPLDLLERIAVDPFFSLSLEQLKEIADPTKFIGRSAHQVDKFLLESVQPHLNRLGKAAKERLSDPDVRV
jgi:adenylosuccinate lyase